MNKITKKIRIKRAIIDEYNEFSTDYASETNKSIFMFASFAGPFVVFANLIYMLIKGASGYVIFPIIGFFIGFILYNVFANYTIRRKTLGYKQVRLICFLSLVLFSAYGIFISLFVDPEEPTLYLPIVILTIQVLYALPVFPIFILSLSTVLIYASLGFLTKDKFVVQYEVYDVFTAYLYGFFINTVLLMTRVKLYQSERRVRAIATVDSQTQLSNATSSEYLCRQYISTIPNNEKFALMLLSFQDLDVSNLLIMKKIGHVLNELFQGKDIIGRMEDNKFLILMEKIDSGNIVEVKARQIIEELEKHGLSPYVGASVTGFGGIDYDEVYKYADIALVQAQVDKEDKYFIFSQEMNSVLSRKKIVLVKSSNNEFRKQMVNKLYQYYTYDSSSEETSLQIMRQLGSYVDLLVIDVDGSNAEDFINNLKSYSETRNIRILGITSNNQTISKLKKLGVENFVQKTVDCNGLCDIINSTLQENQ